METLIFIPLIIGLIVGIIFLITYILRLLWNMTMPEIFDLKIISFWQAFRILIISGILFGGAPNNEVQKIKNNIEEMNEKLETIINDND